MLEEVSRAPACPERGLVLWGTVSTQRMPAARSWSELESQFREISESASRMLNGREPAALLRKPKPESWSAAQCVVHLNLSVDPYFELWARKFERAPRVEPNQSANHRMDLWGKVLVWSLEPPPRFRFPTSADFQPVIEGQAEQVLPDFLERQQRIFQMLQKSCEFDVDTIKIVSPFNGKIRYSIWSSFCVTAAHERRHLWQAERALER